MKKKDKKAKEDKGKEPDVRIWYEKKTKDPETRTGRTFVVMKSKECIAVGISRCSRNDPFCRKIGRDIATGRARLAYEAFGKKAEGARVAVPRMDSDELMMFAVDPKVPSESFLIERKMKLIPEWLLDDRRK